MDREIFCHSGLASQVLPDINSEWPFCIAWHSLADAGKDSKADRKRLGGQPKGERRDGSKGGTCELALLFPYHMARKLHKPKASQPSSHVLYRGWPS